MQDQSDKIQQKESNAAANDQAGKTDKSVKVDDNRAETVAQRKLQAIANTSPQAKQLSAVQHMLNEGRNTKQLKAVTQVPVIQRRAFIGSEYTVPADKDLDAAARTEKNNPHVQRFNSVSELKKYAAGTEEGMGLVNGSWVHLPEKMLVLGEDHGDRVAPQIIEQTNTKKFRYEGFSHHETFTWGDKDGEEHVKEKNTETMGEMGITIADGEKHEAENALPKYARCLADFPEMFTAQRDNTPFKGKNVTAGANLGVEYSVAKKMVQYFYDALIYCKSFKNKFFGHALKTFYEDNTDAIEGAITRFDNLGNNMVDLNGIEVLMNGLTDVYETAAKAKVGLETAAKFNTFVEGLENAPDQAASQRGINNDFLRDKSLLETIKEAKGSARLFVMGDAHRQKLSAKIADLGLPVMRDKDFIKEENDKNIAAAAKNEDISILPLELKKLHIKRTYSYAVRSPERNGIIRVTSIPNTEWRIKDNVGLIALPGGSSYQVTGDYALELVENGTGDVLGKIDKGSEVIQ